MAVRAMAVRSLATATVHYPESDGKPVGETHAHYVCNVVLFQMLEIRYADDPNVLVGGDQMMYYSEGDPRRVFSPDVYVIFGVPKLPSRRTYLLWEEGRPPTVVVEVTSRKTRREDQVFKRALYERLGVQEYVLYDPLDEYLRPRLQGLSLTPAGYAPIEPNAAGRLPSAVLGLELAPHGYELALYDPRTGHWLPTPREEAAARRAEAEGRRAAEAEVARLRAELDRLKGTEA